MPCWLHPLESDPEVDQVPGDVTMGAQYGSAELLPVFQFLTEQLFVNKYKDIILKCNETFSGRYGMEDLTFPTQLESVLRCTAERSTISAACDFYKDEVIDEQLHSKCSNFWQAMI